MLQVFKYCSLTCVPAALLETLSRMLGCSLLSAAGYQYVVYVRVWGFLSLSHSMESVPWWNGHQVRQDFT